MAKRQADTDALREEFIRELAAEKGGEWMERNQGQLEVQWQLLLDQFIGDELLDSVDPDVVEQLQDDFGSQENELATPQSWEELDDMVAASRAEDAARIAGLAPAVDPTEDLGLDDREDG